MRATSSESSAAVCRSVPSAYPSFNAFPPSLDTQRIMRSLGARIGLEAGLPADQHLSDDLLRKLAEAHSNEEIEKILQADASLQKAKAEHLRKMNPAKPDAAEATADAVKAAAHKSAEAFTAKIPSVQIPIMRGLTFISALPANYHNVANAARINRSINLAHRPSRLAAVSGRLARNPHTWQSVIPPATSGPGCYGLY